MREMWEIIMHSKAIFTLKPINIHSKKRIELIYNLGDNNEALNRCNQWI